jgi:hypothetical protein
MRGQDGGGFDHGVVERFSAGPLRLGDPIGRQAERGLGGLGGADDRAGGGAVVHGQVLLGIGFALADGLALDRTT